MSVSNGQPVNASVTNNAFVSRLIDTSTVGKLSLENTETESGASVSNVQEEINNSIDHIASSSVHGVGGASNVVGTNTTQNITNKTFTDLLKARLGLTIGDESADGSWKIKDDSTDLIFQRKESGVYEDKLVLPDGALASRKLVSFATDGDYSTAYGALTGGEIYWNTSTLKARIYDGTQWKVVGAEIIGNQEIPTGLVNGTNVDFTLSLAPLSEETIIVTLDGLIVDDSLWSYASGTITFTTAPRYNQLVYVYYLTEGSPTVPIIVSGTQEVEYHQVTTAEMLTKSFLLNHLPLSPTKVVADEIEGVALHYGVDFNVSTDVFNWSGLGLDGVISTGDIIRLQYFY